MRFLIVGYSSIVVRRALSALLQLPEIESVDIASRRPVQRSRFPENWSGRTYDDYREAISDSRADVVYVSLVNSLHEEWVDTALRSGKHVVVDKPAFLTLAAADKLLELAAKEGLCLAEAVVFPYHPQMAALQRLLLAHGGATRLIATFTFPPLANDNFRNHPELGGGSLYDLGPYAAAVSRLFFGDLPARVGCNVVSRHSVTTVDTAFSVLASYSGGRSYIGHFGFDTEYQNRLTLIGPEIAITVDRVFTTTSDFQNHLDVSCSGQQWKVPVEVGDSFEHFFASVVGAIEKHCWSAFAEDLWQDAQILGTMRAAALGEYRR